MNLRKQKDGKNSLEACKQCKRTIIPEIKEPVVFADLFEKLRTMILLWCLTKIRKAMA